MSIQSVSSMSQTPNILRQPAVDAALGKNTENVETSATKNNSDVKSDSDLTTTTPPLDEELNAVVKEVNDFVRPLNNSLHFSIDKETGTTVVKVIDTETQEMIKQIPSEEMLALAKALDQLKGLLVKQQA